MIQRTGGFLYLVPILLFVACSPGYRSAVSPFPVLRDTQDKPDYSKLECWAAHPDKIDPSDSIPQPLQASFMQDSSVDVFFLHPTTLTSFRDTRWNAGIDDTAINRKTDNSTILYQASAFNECRVFAPRYRQAHLRAYYTNDTVSAHKAFDLAYADIKTSFQYYLDHFNQGRPIIIASHSQGTTHAKRLLKEFFENTPLKNKLVAAYIIGMSIPQDYFSGLQACGDSNATGCLVGWRTFRKGFEPPFVMAEKGSSLVVNPLNWRVDSLRAKRTLNKGAVLIKFNSVVLHATDAQIHEGVLWVHRPHFRGSILVRTKNYHIGDINLFYVNIRDNVRTRIRNYWKQKQ